MIVKNIENIEELQIWFLLEELGIPNIGLGELTTKNIKTLGLNKKAWTYIKGRRDIREYTHNDNLCVRFRYEYILDNKNVTDYDIFIEFIKTDGNVGLTKIINKELSKKYLTEFNRIIRQNQVDYLMGAGNGFREEAENYPEPIKSQLIQFANLVDAMWLRYETEILEYINTGNQALENIINNESDPVFLAGLNQIDPSTGLTMKQTILNEIT